MDDFDRATRRARWSMRRMLADGLPPITVADAAIVQAAAIWAAATDRLDDAKEFLAIWTALRDLR